MRAFVAELLTEWQRTDRLDDALYCASELSTNAVQHGEPVGRDFLVRMAVHDDLLRMEVHDSAAATPKLRDAGPDDRSGRGLFLVAALTDEWGIDSRSGPGKVVWAAFKLSDATPTRLACRQPIPQEGADIPPSADRAPAAPRG